MPKEMESSQAQAVEPDFHAAPEAPAAQAPAQQFDEPVDESNFLEHPRTPASRLHAWAKEHVAQSNPRLMGSDSFQLAIKHPNMPTDALRALYQRYQELARDSDHREDATSGIKSILEHPNASASDAENVIQNHHGIDSHMNNSLVEAAAKHPGVDREYLKRLTDEMLSQPERYADGVGTAHLQDIDPDYFLDKLRQRPQWEPETDNMTAEQTRTNNQARNIDQVALKGLVQTKLHTPENTQKVFDQLHASRPEGMTNQAHNEFFKDYIQHNPHVTHNQLETLFRDSRDDGHYGSSGTKLREDVLKHPNVDPAFLARVALAGAKDPLYDGITADKFDDEIRPAAATNPRLPEEARKKIIQSAKPSDIERKSPRYQMLMEMMRSPNAKPEDLKSLYERGIPQALEMPNTPQDLIAQEWDKVPEDRKINGTETARRFLQMPNVPPQVLRDIVQHKNQNLAVEAINHDNADESVVQAGLKRKAGSVKEAASRHPKAPIEAVLQNLQSGVVSGHDALFGSKEISARRKRYGVTEEPTKLPSEAMEAIHNRYNGFSKENIEATEGRSENPFKSYLRVKTHLATDPGIDPAIREKNKSDIVTHFKDSVPPGHFVPLNSFDGSAAGETAQLVHQFADDGDHQAQDALLQRPGNLSFAALSKPTYDSAFLDKAYEELSKPISAVPVGTEPGRTISWPYAGESITKIALNPNASDELFHKATTDPRFLAQSKNYVKKEGNFDTRDDSVATVFDMRMKSRPEAQRKAFFDGLLGSDAGCAAVLASRTAPKESWDQAWLGASKDGDEEFLSKFNIAHYLDAAGKRDALMGRFDSNVSNKFLRGLYEKVLAGLDTSDASLTTMKEFLDRESAGLTAVNDPRHMLDGDHFAHNLNDKWFELDHAPALAAELMNPARPEIARQYGSAFVARAAAKIAGSQWQEPEKKDAAAKFAIASLASGTEAMAPWDANSALANRWKAMLQSDDGEQFASTISQRAKESGQFDFLAEVGDGAENVGGLALIRGLLSPAKAAQIDLQDPSAFIAGMSTPEPRSGEKAHLVQNALSSGTVNPEILDSMANGMKGAWLLPPGDTRQNRTRLSDATKASELEFAKQNVGKFFDHAVNTDPRKAPNQIKSFMHCLQNDDQKPASGGLYTDELAMIKHFVAGKINGMLLSDSQKIGLQWDAGLIDRGDVVAHVVRTGDLHLATRLMSQDGFNTPIRIQGLVATAMEEPGNLNTDQMKDILTALPKIMKYDGGDQQWALPAFIEEVELRMASDQMLSEMAFEEFNNVLDEDVHMDVKRPILGCMMRHQEQPGVFASLGKQVSTNSTIASPATKKEVYMSMLDSPSQKMLSEFSWEAPDELHESLVNDPDIIERSTDGWRFRAMMRSYASMNEDTLKIMTNRVMNSPQLVDEDKSWFAAKMISNENAASEDVTKALRMTNPNSIIETLESAAKSMTDPSNSAIHEGFDLAAAALRDAVDGKLGVKAGGMPYDPEHVAFITHKASAVFTIARRYRNTSAIKDGKAKQEKVDMLLDHALVAIESVAEKTTQAAQSAPEYDPVAGTDAVGMLTYALQDMYPSAYRDSGDENARIYNEDHSRKALELWHKAEVLDDLVHKKLDELPGRGNEPRATRTEKATFLSKWMGRSKVSDDDWNDIFQMHPEAAFALSHMKTIPVAAMEMMPVDEILKNDDPDLGDSYLGSMIEKMYHTGGEKAGLNILDRGLAMQARSGTAGRVRDSLLSAFNGMLNYAPQAIPTDKLMELEKVLGKLDHWSPEKIIRSGAGGQPYVDHLMKRARKDPELLSHIARSPYLTEEHADALKKAIGPSNPSVPFPPNGPTGDIVSNLIKNPSAPASVINWLCENHFDEHMGDATAKDLMRNPQLTQKNFMQIYSDTADAFALSPNESKYESPAFKNAKHGGELLRSVNEPSEMVESIRGAKHGINTISSNPDLLITAASYSAQRQKLNQILPAIPPDGISWVDFKRANPAMENWPETRKLFEGKMGQNDKVIPEDIAATAEKYPSNQFSVTYGKWTGAQRHADRPNLVMQLNNSPEMEKALADDPKLAQFYQIIQEASSYSSHPVTPQSVGWVRIDTSAAEKGWIVEEFQSDFTSKLKTDLERAMEQVRGKLAERGVHMTPSEIFSYVPKIEKLLSGWYHSALAGVEELAKKQGVKTLYIHGPNVRAALSGMERSKGRDLPVKLKEMYGKEPPKFGYEKCHYTDYPHWSESLVTKVQESKDQDKKDILCWKKKLK